MPLYEGQSGLWVATKNVVLTFFTTETINQMQKIVYAPESRLRVATSPYNVGLNNYIRPITFKVTKHMNDPPE